jgi:hypothetical protein
MLRVAFPHKTDGVGGHVVTATSALGGAALLGLRLVCDPAMLFNGHMAQSDPHLGSRLLLGCDEGDADGQTGGEACVAGAEDGSWFRLSSRHEASLHQEVRVGTWAELAARVAERSALLGGAPLQHLSHPPIVFTLAPPFFATAADPDATAAGAATARGSAEPGGRAAGWFLSACSPDRAALWPAAAALLRGRYHRAPTSAGFTSPEASAGSASAETSAGFTSPEATAAPLWASIGGARHGRCHRVTVQWRTAAWSPHRH